jgi:hypothetical protein
MALSLMVAALMLCFGGNAYGAITLVNPSFEDGGTVQEPPGDIPGWVAVSGSFLQQNPTGLYPAFFDPRFVGGGSQVGQTASATGSIEGSLTSSSVAGAIYIATIAVRAMPWDSDGTPVTFDILEGGTVVGTRSQTVGGSDWTMLYVCAGFTADPTCTMGATGGQSVTARLTFGDAGALDALDASETLVNGPGPGPGEIPEPFTMGLVGSGLLGVALLRLRRK